MGGCGGDIRGISGSTCVYSVGLDIQEKVSISTHTIYPHRQDQYGPDIHCGNTFKNSNQNNG